MGRFLVSGRGGGVAVDFDENEPGGVVGLLEHIETRDAGLATAGVCICERGSCECVDVFRFDVNMNVDGEHGEGEDRFPQGDVAHGESANDDRRARGGWFALPEAGATDSRLPLTTTPVQPRIMKLRILVLALACAVGLGDDAFAQGQKSSKGGEKKAPAPKTPADLAYDAFNKVRTEKSAMNQARFAKVISAGMAYLMEHPTHSRVNDAIRDLAFFGTNLDRQQAALRMSYSSLLKLDVTNSRYKEGLSDPVKVVLAALDASIADNDVRESFSGDNLNTFREKIDALAELPGSSRYLVDRERGYAHVVMIGTNPARAEAHLKKLLEHKDKAVVAMAKEELNILEAKKEPVALKLTALDGKEVDLSQLRGKVVALYFWSSASKPSTDRIEPLKQFYSNYRKRNFEIVTVSYDKPEDRAKLEKYIKDNRVAWPVVFDGKGTKSDVGAKYNVTSVPRLLVFDQKGLLQTTLAGSPVARVTPDIPMNQLEGLVKQLMGIKTPAKK